CRHRLRVMAALYASSARSRSAEGGLEGKIKKDRVLSAAGAEADRDADPRNDLKAARIVIRPADSGADEKARRALDAAGGSDGLGARPKGFQENIERPPEPDQTSTGVIADRIRLLPTLVASGRRHGRADIPMRDPIPGENRAHRHGDLNTGRA